MSPPKPSFIGAVSLKGTDEAEMMRKGYRVFFYLNCRDNRIPAGPFLGMKPKFGGRGPRRATFRIWAKPGSVLTIDELLSTFRANMFTAWRRDRYGKDAWWYVTEPIIEDETGKHTAVRDACAYMGDGTPKWEGWNLRLPR